MASMNRAELEELYWTLKRAYNRLSDSATKKLVKKAAVVVEASIGQLEQQGPSTWK